MSCLRRRNLCTALDNQRDCYPYHLNVQWRTAEFAGSGTSGRRGKDGPPSGDSFCRRVSGGPRAQDTSRGEQGAGEERAGHGEWMRVDGVPPSDPWMDQAVGMETRCLVRGGLTVVGDPLCCLREGTRSGSLGLGGKGVAGRHGLIGALGKPAGWPDWWLDRPQVPTDREAQKARVTKSSGAAVSLARVFPRPNQRASRTCQPANRDTKRSTKGRSHPHCLLLGASFP